MFSVITCSTNSNFLNLLEQSIKKTCLLDYEIIFIDNSVEKLSLTKAYNIGALKARYPNLVFVHEDVEFINTGWDQCLLNIIENKQFGIVGIAGSTYLPSTPSGWYLPDEKYNKVFIRQGFKYKEAPVRFDNQGEDLTPVFLLDGVFLAMRKEVWMEFPFNERLGGFHAYDVDICQRVCSKYQNLFTNQIELLHKSEGKVDEIYFDSILSYKKPYLNYNYPKRDFKIEVELLKQLYLNIRCFYDKYDSISKIKNYYSIRILGIYGYFKFKKFLKNAR